METLTKPANELSTADLEALLEQRKAAEATERQQARLNYEQLRDDTILKLVAAAQAISGTIKDFKAHCNGELGSLYKLLQEHSSRHTDGKGSFTLETTDKLFRVIYRRQESTRFDERATQAERHILDFLTSQFGDDSPTSKLVRRLLERKKGQMDKDAVLQLISMKDEFTNENWRKGIELLAESIVPGETRYYTQFQMRFNEGDEFENILLDFARL